MRLALRIIAAMTTDHSLPAADACYNAVLAKDARFDGQFFIGVSSTGIYCRPVCRVRTPKRDNCSFFRLAAQAEVAGFRPCLRCRPELAPRLVQSTSPAWSTQDASRILARQAAALLDTPDAWADEVPSVPRLAARLGVSDRHVRRIFEAEFGVSPLQYLQTRRLLSAKQLLTDTDLAVTQVAALCGFGSLRRFNAAFAEHYRLNPTQLRRSRGLGPQQVDATDLIAVCRTSMGARGRFSSETAANNASDVGQAGCILLRLSYRPPYDVDAMLAFMGKRLVHGVECIEELSPQPDSGPDSGAPGTRLQDGATTHWWGRTLRLTHGGREHTGWLQVRFLPARCQVELRVATSLLDALPLVLSRVRALLDLDADPAAIHAVLGARFPLGEGLRVPGCMDGFELAVRAVLGQQITVAAARTLAQRLLALCGEPMRTPVPGLDRLFPTAQALANTPADALGQLGIVRQRQAAIHALARAVNTGDLRLTPGVDVTATLAALQALPGIGDWTAQYIAMRALRWPDAFPAGDVALHKALGVQGHKHAAAEALALTQDCRPWRSYAVLRAWSSLAP